MAFLIIIAAQDYLHFRSIGTVLCGMEKYLKDIHAAFTAFVSAPDAPVPRIVGFKPFQNKLDR